MKKKTFFLLLSVIGLGIGIPLSRATYTLKPNDINVGIHVSQGPEQIDRRDLVYGTPSAFTLTMDANETLELPFTLKPSQELLNSRLNNNKTYVTYVSYSLSSDTSDISTLDWDFKITSYTSYSWLINSGDNLDINTTNAVGGAHGMNFSVTYETGESGTLTFTNTGTEQITFSITMKSEESLNY